MSGHGAGLCQYFSHTHTHTHTVWSACLKQPWASEGRLTRVLPFNRCADSGQLFTVSGVQHAEGGPRDAPPHAPRHSEGPAGLFRGHTLWAGLEPLQQRRGHNRLCHSRKYWYLDAHFLVHSKCADRMLCPHPYVPHSHSAVNAVLLVGPGK